MGSVSEEEKLLKIDLRTHLDDPIPLVLDYEQKERALNTNERHIWSILQEQITDYGKLLTQIKMQTLSGAMLFIFSSSCNFHLHS
jgi:hypothetical protein